MYGLFIQTDNGLALESVHTDLAEAKTALADVDQGAVRFALVARLEDFWNVEQSNALVE